MQPLAVHHVSITVTDVDTAFAFYTDVLGLVARHDRPDFGFGGAWLDAGAQQLHLVEGWPPEDRGQHFALRVADLDDTVCELRGAALRSPIRRPRDRPGRLSCTTPRGTWSSCSRR